MFGSQLSFIMDALNILYADLISKTNLSHEDFEQFKTFLNFKSISKNDYLLRRGEKARSMAFVTEGVMCTFSVDEKGERHVIQIALQNHWITDLFSLFSE